MAVIAGARTFHQVRATVRAGFMPVMKVSWITSPLALAFAQQFLPEHTWVPFFNIISFVIGTWINSQTKKKRLQALRRKVTPRIPVRIIADWCDSTMVMMGDRVERGLNTRSVTTRNLMRRRCIYDGKVEDRLAPVMVDIQDIAFPNCTMYDCGWILKISRHVEAPLNILSFVIPRMLHLCVGAGRHNVVTRLTTAQKPKQANT